MVLETHLGWAAGILGFRAVTPVFDGAPDTAIEDSLGQAWIVQQSGAADPRAIDRDGDRQIDHDVVRDWLSERGYDYDALFGELAERGAACEASVRVWLQDERGMDTSAMSSDEVREEALRLNRDERVAAPFIGKSTLYDGRTGEPFDQPITVGQIYMMKLIHLVEDKIHARSTWPVLPHHPAAAGRQGTVRRPAIRRNGSVGARSLLRRLQPSQEMLTVKSDDTVGRVKTYEAIVKGEDVIQPGIPESFHVLMKELQSLGLSVELMYEEPEELSLGDFDDDDIADVISMANFVESMELDDTPPFAMPGDPIIESEARQEETGQPEDRPVEAANPEFVGDDD